MTTREGVRGEVDECGDPRAQAAAEAFAIRAECGSRRKPRVPHGVGTILSRPALVAAVIGLPLRQLGRLERLNRGVRRADVRERLGEVAQVLFAEGTEDVEPARELAGPVDHRPNPPITA